MGIVWRIVDSIVIGTFRQEEAAFLDGNILVLPFHTGTFVLLVLSIYLLFVLFEEDVRIAEEDQSQNGLTVFVRCQMCSCT